MTTRTTTPLQEDAAKFLRLLLSECGTLGSGDHAWWKCKRCLAFDQLRGHDPLARRLVEEALKALTEPPQ